MGFPLKSPPTIEAMSARGPCSSAPPDIRRTNRPVSFVVNGPLIGAGFYSLLYAMSRIASDEPQAMTMISDKVPADLVAGFQQTVASTQNHIGGWYLLIGAIAGAIAWGFWHLWSGARGRPAPTGKALVLRILAALFCIHSWVVIRALSDAESIGLQVARIDNPSHELLSGRRWGRRRGAGGSIGAVIVVRTSGAVSAEFRKIRRTNGRKSQRFANTTRWPGVISGAR